MPTPMKTEDHKLSSWLVGNKYKPCNSQTPLQKEMTATPIMMAKTIW